ncbi:cell division protein ZapD [Ideonella sp. DXS22W]|uniref:Cell division protein ZapD n=1 Tax=Pseudaquabacterium inlustre TaxID=2984192 RepID=A0ABU9CCU6_9BURK
MVLYEYPFNESVRTMLRLEHLFDRLGQLIVRDAPVDHHFALVTLFEIIEVASRSDLKADLLKDLDRHRGQLAALRDNPQVEPRALEALIARIEQAFEQLNAQTGKAGQALAGNEWLTSVKSRISIPGGTCEFDLPAYYAWQQFDATRRRADLMGWVNTLAPLAGALQLLLQLVREAGVPHKVASSGGQYQQSLPQGRSYQLLRLRIDGGNGLVPEITGHRLMVAVRLMRVDGEGRLRPAGSDADFELTLCA